jgi:hypothetical protein
VATLLAEEIEDGRLRIEDGKLAAKHRRNGQVRRLPYTFSGYREGNGETKGFLGEKSRFY